VSLYTILVFVHVTSAIGLSAGNLISLFGLFAMRRAQRVEQVRAILGLLALSEPVSAIALVLTPAAGVTMTITTWGWRNGWITVALGSFVLLLSMGVITGLRRGAIAKLVNEMPDGPLPASVEQRIHDPLLGTAVYMLVALLLGIVFLMTTKPALDGALIAIAVSVVLGAAASLPLWCGRIGEEAGSGDKLTDEVWKVHRENDQIHSEDPLEQKS
jgi:hypothetical protein